jgi:iron complex transport system substrate-binding protein
MKETIERRETPAPMLPETDEETEGREDLGLYPQPNLEVMAALEPDLILGVAGDGDYEAQYEGFSGIAPTVLFGVEDIYDWKGYIRKLVAATGYDERSEEGFDEYEARVEGIRGRLRDVTLSHLVISGPDNMSTYVQGPMAYSPFRVLEEVGVRRPPFEVVEDDTVSKPVTLETLNSLRGTVLFYNLWTDELSEGERRAAESVLDSPLWRQIPAVRNGEAYQVGVAQWMNFGGLRSAHLVLDDIEEHLTREG